MRSTIGILFLVFVLTWSNSSFARIRMNVGGAKYSTVSGDLSVSITVDTLTPTVAVGTAADQSFRDDSVGAAFFGYYLTVGIRTQTIIFGGINIKIQRGATETSGRSYYLLGNGTTVPTLQSQLTQAPASATTFTTAANNSTECGPNNVANGVDGVNSVNCPVADDPNMDVTQFVKVLFTDPPSAAIKSMLTFTAVNE